MPKTTSVQAALQAITSDPSKILGLDLNGQSIQPGQFVPRAKAQSPPTLTYTATPGPYIAIAIDLDAPFPSFDVLGPILHWVQPGLRSADASTGLTAGDVPFVADYIGPAPPPGSAPHRYVFLLYAQPEGFDGAAFAPADGKPLSLWLRMRFDLDAFEKKAGLGPVLAVNYLNSN